MRRLLLVVLVIGMALLGACAPPPEPKPFPPPEGYSSWDEYHEEYQRRTGSTQPAPSEETETKVEVELEYEAQSYVKKAYHDTRFIMGSVAFSKDQDEIRKALEEAYSLPEYYPVGHVNVRNTDKIQGTFKVEIVFRSDDKDYREVFTLELEPGQVGEVEKSANIHYDNDEWSFQYEVIPDTKPVEK